MMTNLTVTSNSSKATATMSINVYYTPQFAAAMENLNKDIIGWLNQVITIPIVTLG